MKTMKMSIPTKTMNDAMKKSSIAALVPEAQDEEKKKINPTNACVRVRYSQGKGVVVFESSSPPVSIIHAVTIDENIKGEDGLSFCVDAAEYSELLSRLPVKSALEIQHSKIKTEQDDGSEVINPDGKLITIINSEDEKIGNAKNNTFPVEHFTNVNYNFNDVLMSTKASTLKKAIKSVVFATDSQYETAHAMAYVAFLIKDNKVHCAGTNGRRCAIFSIDGENIKLSSDRLPADGQDIKLLFNPDIITKVIEAFDDEDEIRFVLTDVEEQIILASPKTMARICMPPSGTANKYPNFLVALDMQTPTNVVVNRKDLITALNVAELYNKEKSLIIIKESQKRIRIEAARRGDEAEGMSASCDLTTFTAEKPIGISNRYLQDGLKKTDDEEVKMSFDDAFSKIKIEPKTKVGYTYIMQSMI
jgi:DNA polymerase III sliding clamp (beta) subunit (PCNA family)